MSKSAAVKTFILKETETGFETRKLFSACKTQPINALSSIVIGNHF